MGKYKLKNAHVHEVSPGNASKAAKRQNDVIIYPTSNRKPDKSPCNKNNKVNSVSPIKIMGFNC